MNLRSKTLIIISVTLVALLLFLFLISQTLLMGSYLDLEDTNTRQNTELSQDALFYELSQMETLSSNMADAIDTSTSAENLNTEDITSTLADKTSANSQINFILFISPTNQVIYAKAFEPGNNTEANISRSMTNYLSQENPILKYNDTSTTTGGILLLPEGPILISSSPTKKGDNGPFEGTLIVGKYLNSTEIAQLQTANSNLTINPFSDTDKIPTYHEVSASYSQNPSIIVKPLNSSHIADYSILRDNQGKAVYELDLQMPRTIYSESNNTLFLFLISFLIVGLVLMTTTLLYMDRFVLFRLSRLTDEVSSIAQNPKLSKRLAIIGKDELARLASSINDMLMSITLSQQEIQESRKKYKSIFKNTGTAIATIEDNDIISLVNAEFEKLSGYSRDELENKKSWFDFFEGQDLEISRKYRRMRKFDHDSAPRNYEVGFFDRYKNYKYIFLTVSMIPGSKKSLISCMDITAIKKSEKNLRKSLKEKELLIREIHHRVKNNMQIITSLLSLQSAYLENDEITEILRECQNRVHSMGMIHESLYQSTDLSSIKFDEYIQKLISELFISYGVDTNNIKAKLDVEAISLGIDTAIPCGMLINELVSNSLKHAFPDGQGEIYVVFHHENNHHENREHYILKVGDNGVGLPDGLDIENTGTLGLNLVNTLIRQLDGTLELHKNDKTEFVIRFRELEYKRRI